LLDSKWGAFRALAGFWSIMPYCLILVEVVVARSCAGDSGEDAAAIGVEAPASMRAVRTEVEMGWQARRRIVERMDAITARSHPYF